MIGEQTMIIILAAMLTLCTGVFIWAIWPDKKRGD